MTELELDIKHVLHSVAEAVQPSPVLGRGAWRHGRRRALQTGAASALLATCAGGTVAYAVQGEKPTGMVTLGTTPTAAAKPNCEPPALGVFPPTGLSTDPGGSPTPPPGPTSEALRNLTLGEQRPGIGLRPDPTGSGKQGEVSDTNWGGHRSFWGRIWLFGDGVAGHLKIDLGIIDGAYCLQPDAEGRIAGSTVTGQRAVLGDTAYVHGTGPATTLWMRVGQFSVIAYGRDGATEEDLAAVVATVRGFQPAG